MDTVNNINYCIWNIFITIKNEKTSHPENSAIQKKEYFKVRIFRYENVSFFYSSFNEEEKKNEDLVKLNLYTTM